MSNANAILASREAATAEDLRQHRPDSSVETNARRLPEDYLARFLSVRLLGAEARISS